MIYTIVMYSTFLGHWVFWDIGFPATSYTSRWSALSRSSHPHIASRIHPWRFLTVWGDTKRFRRCPRKVGPQEGYFTYLRQGVLTPKYDFSETTRWYPGHTHDLAPKVQNFREMLMIEFSVRDKKWKKLGIFRCAFRDFDFSGTFGRQELSDTASHCWNLIKSTQDHRQTAWPHRGKCQTRRFWSVRVRALFRVFLSFLGHLWVTFFWDR